MDAIIVKYDQGFPERSQEGCVFFEVDRHLAGQDAEDKVHQDASALGSPAQVEEARISSILWEASHAFINTSSASVSSLPQSPD
ncbi:hypothetical protein NGA_0473010 [Nannochloropsis gaditana CCMP526]|uniref:uncharacterized protein n=1 Tax=Nannochloropsis gaditana (strain CCMP526) TaxID=1093141 RepID=UPI00029F6872|nr:hypothetical protein NGA_0473010 [Nannochloropsis gaditana CCMP526]EKU22807.1 hypothetical protein NGA_0473010 [Nannochloropsis gaditana CCMP526]|eukprot:XP_005853558.1 hypothetical protein NGA_0473010 [Nannochloropsis gaditana CCMP526]